MSNWKGYATSICLNHIGVTIFTEGSLARLESYGWQPLVLQSRCGDDRDAKVSKEDFSKYCVYL